MSVDTFADRIAKLSPKKLALLATQLYERSAAPSAVSEPIAIVAMACRLPGDCDTPDAFWSLLERGGDATSTVPAERAALTGDGARDLIPGADARSRHGAFLRDIDCFDAALFGISAKEAINMDPQQRLLLEVCWEALENAGTPIDALRGSDTGVFVGASGIDYQILRAFSQPAPDGYTLTGSANAVIAGRIAYAFGFHGPSTVVDTACSASAAAIHLACQSLRSRECDRALAGGVNLALLPYATHLLDGMEALSHDGRCKAFAASADGFGRGEGCAMLVLRRLDDAALAGDPVLAVIRGSAWNQDGRSSGLTAPNGLAQERVVRAALRAAGVQSGDVSYVEAHGTGTALGDPIEIDALARVFGERDRATPLHVGSVKTNVAHLEAAAGIASVMKVVLALQHDRIPPHLHLSERNPRIPWDAIPIDVPANGAPWPRGEAPRIAGVSSFGFSGTNVHLVIADAPGSTAPRAHASVERDEPAVLTASAKSADALARLAFRYAQALERGGTAFARFAASANRNRSPLPHRLALVASGAREAAAELRLFAAGDSRTRVRSAFVETHRPVRVGVLHPEDEPLWRALGVVPWEASTPCDRVVERSAADAGAVRDEAIALYLAGVAIDWTPLHGDVAADALLPNYPFERTRYWITPPARNAAAARMPAPSALVRDAHANAVRSPAVDAADAARFEDDVERFALHSSVTALRALRPSLAAGAAIPLDDSCAALGVVPAQRRLLERMLRLLAEHGVARADGTGWTLVHDLAAHDLDEELRQLRSRYPFASIEIEVAARTLELPRVLRGELSGVDVLFPDGSFALASALYRDTPAARTLNAQVASVVREIGRGAQRPLRVLEIGAGTGGTTSAVLDALPSGGEYVFTDLSTGFLAAARAAFRDRPGMRYELLDVEDRARVDALASPPFDVAIAANVLHATRSVRDTLANVKRLLRPDGYLVLLEATTSLAIADIAFGATEGWSHRTDLDLRPLGPLLSRETWLNVLRDAGFDADALAGDGVATKHQTVVVARPAQAAAVAKPATRSSFDAFARRLADTPPSERAGAIVEFLRVRANELLERDPATPIDAGTPLIDIGLDSLVGLELRNDLQNLLHVQLPSTVFFEHPTIAALARYLELVTMTSAVSASARASDGVERVTI